MATRSGTRRPAPAPGRIDGAGAQESDERPAIDQKAIWRRRRRQQVGPRLSPAFCMKNPPTGIIRTLPSLYTDPKNPGWRGLSRSIAHCEADESAYFYIALAAQPKHDILHLYLLVGNQITMRFNLAGYAPGHE